MQQGRILVVDDDPTFREMISHYLKKKYTEVLMADCGISALACLEKAPFDLIISDINMPEMKGYELLGKVKELYPKIKTALITGWSIDENIKNALEYGVSNIISKSVPFDFNEFDFLINRLLSGNIFGLIPLMESGAELHVLRLTRSDELDEARQIIISFLRDGGMSEDRLLAFQLVIEEAFRNALYLPLDKSRSEFVEVPKDKAVEVVYGKDHLKFGLSVRDLYGKMDVKTILENLDQCIEPSGRDDYTEDIRGIFIIRSMVSRTIINLHRNYKTEVNMLINFDPEEKENKPLLIYEL